VWAALLPATGIAVLVLAFAGLASAARADGDPASDVLATQSLFLPQDAGVTLRQQAQLAALLAATKRGGYDLRVALIASPTDLGSIPALWRQPQSYAEYLGQELSVVASGTLLVVMPDGYGVYRTSGVRAAEQAAVAGLPPPGTALGAAALAAIRRLAAADGHSLPLPSVSTTAAPGSTDTVGWLVFAAGLAVIAAAWTLSLRARPLRVRA
jgi:hypothetical protein